MINDFLKNQNNKIVIGNIIASFIIKGVSLLLSLFMIPAYLRFFADDAIYGVWLTILSVLNWVLYFDIGISHGLRNKIIEPIVHKDWKTVKEYISSAYISVGILALFLLGIGAVLFKYVNWNQFFNISSEDVPSDTLFLIVSIASFSVIAQFVLRTITSILYALQKAFVPNLLNMISSASLFLFICFASSESIENNLLKMVCANVITVNIPLIIVTVIVFSTSLKNCVPSIRTFNSSYAKDIMHLGSTFFLLQILQMVLMNTNEFLITWFISPNAVVEYQLYNKLFGTVSMVFGLAIVPIWSAFAKAKAENDFNWIQKTHNAIMMLGLVGIMCELALIPILQFVMNIWLGSQTIHVNYITAIFFALCSGSFMWMTFESNVTNGLGELRIQKIFVTLGTIGKIPLAFILAKITGSYEAILIANIIAILPYCIMQPLWMRKYLATKLS